MADFQNIRREQLETSIRENLELLGQYRQERNLSDDPRRRKFLEKQINDREGTKTVRRSCR